MPSEIINPVRLSSIAPKHDKSQFSNMAARSMSDLVNISMMSARSELDRLRLASRLDMSKFSASKLLIRPSKSRSSKLRPNNFNIAVMVSMSISRLLKRYMTFARLIADRSKPEVSMPRSDRSIPSESSNPVRLSSIAPKHDKSRFSNTPPKLLNISIMEERSRSDRFRPANRLDMSKFSTSKPLIKPLKSRLPKSIVDNFPMAPIAVMTNSEFFNASMISDRLISDNSQSATSIPNSDKSMSAESSNPVKSSLIASKPE